MTNPKRTRLPAILLCLCAFMPHANASDWQFVEGFRGSPAMIKVDRDSIVSIGPTRYAWFKLRFYAPQPLAGRRGETYAVLLGYIELNCALRMYALRRTDFLANEDASRPILSQRGDADSMVEVAPDTIAERVFNAICTPRP